LPMRKSCVQLECPVRVDGLRDQRGMVAMRLGSQYVTGQVRSVRSRMSGSGGHRQTV
jgi:hypothetical protein